MGKIQHLIFTEINEIINYIPGPEIKTSSSEQVLITYCCSHHHTCKHTVDLLAIGRQSSPVQCPLFFDNRKAYEQDDSPFI